MGGTWPLLASASRCADLVCKLAILSYSAVYKQSSGGSYAMLLLVCRQSNTCYGLVAA